MTLSSNHHSSTMFPDLLQKVAEAREQTVACAEGLSHEQANFKPDPDTWSISETIEHLVYAEDGGVGGMWDALIEYNLGHPSWEGELIHQGSRIEEVVDKTWQTKEKVPESAAPQWGGAIGYWIAALKARQQVLEAFGEAVGETDLESIIHPHPISGPLDIRQRLEFLRFHMERHQKQIEELKKHPAFPSK